jgi:uracil phosphoribosyltransferase
MTLHVVHHPLVAHRVAALRDQATDSATFRLLVSEIATFLAYEALRDLPTVATTVHTPLDVDAPAQRLDGTSPIVVPILRAGLGLLDPVLRAVPTAQVAVVGLRRDEVTFEPVQYCAKLPDDLAGRDAIVLDPMLATGGSMVATFDLLRKSNAGRLRALCLLAAPEGIERVEASYPDAQITVAALDSHLNEHAYIVPGLGDAGDRLFGPPGVL